MATIISTAQSSYGLASSEAIVVTTSGVLSSTSGAALSSLFSNNNIRVSGTLDGETGIALVGLNGSFAVITLSATGSIFGGSTGIATGGDTTVINNAGSIMSGGAAIRIDSIIEGSTTRITNTGLISGDFGIIVSANETALYSDVSLINHGIIAASASSSAAYSNQHADGVDGIINYGTIDGSIDTGTSGDRVTNYGSITGSINMGTGDDNVNNTFSEDGLNNINLGGGADTAILGMAEEIVYGGAGFDVVSYRDSSGVRVNLANILLNTKEAARDYYVEIEQVAGSQYYADTLIGDTRANWLFGVGGNDVLSGGGGSDTLQGSADNDRLTGGLGNDSFLFELGEPGRDIITDFTNAAGNNDRFQFYSTGLAPGQIVSGQFRARADNLAQDSNDRFIFRTGDKTLWFDIDGAGGQAAVMLADLQASATVTYQDISILS